MGFQSPRPSLRGISWSSLPRISSARSAAASSPIPRGWRRIIPNLPRNWKICSRSPEALEQWKTQKEAECLKQNRLDEFAIKQLGDCEIVREIGRGGMGVVFEAHQGQWKRRVAVKMLPWRLGNALPRWKERFQEEAQTIARLRHPNIVPIYTFGEHQGYCYYVMQLVEGLSLDRVLAALSNPAELPQAAAMLARRLNVDHWPSPVRITAQVCLALEHAHAAGILHNDIKPANLLLDPSGQIPRHGLFGAPAADRVRRADRTRQRNLSLFGSRAVVWARRRPRRCVLIGVSLYELLIHNPPLKPRTVKNC